ncbi:hypothetical protein AHF37_01155, partial [Paragonimus kellicotti]
CFRVIRALGCHYGHRSSPTFGARELVATDVTKCRSDNESTEARQLAQDCLYHLYESDCSLFARILSRLIATMCVADLMEMFHSLTGFCLDPAAHNTNQIGRLTSQSNYSNSFGQPTSGYGIRGAEGIVVACALGPFIRRLVRCRAELISQENVSLFGDVRQLFTYFREVHGSTFRRHMLVAMMCPIHRALERPKPKTQMNWSRMSTRNSMWLLPRQDKRRSSSIFFDGLVDMDQSTGSLKGQRFTSWHALLPRASMVGRGVRINSGPGNSIAGDKSTDASHSRGDGDASSSGGGGSGGLQTVIEHRWVNAPALKEGLLDFAFLMEICEPGTIPEPQLIAALLDLNAPVIARACLLLECALLVHRCNRGEWASWMKFNLPSSFQLNPSYTNLTATRTSPGAGGSGGCGGGTGKETVVLDTMVSKQNAGRLFHAWGEGARFLCILDMTTFQSATVNPTGESCPYALLSVSVQLLLEITTYLRETHQRLPQNITTAAPANTHEQQQTQTTGNELNAKKSLTKESSHERSGSFGKHPGSTISGPTASFRAARRRLSILMPIFGSGGSMNMDNGDTEVDQPLISDQHTTGRRNLTSRRISFAVFTDTKDRRGSFRGSATSLDHSPESEKPALSKSLLRHHRGSGSFKRSLPSAREALGVYSRQFSTRKWSGNGESFVMPASAELTDVSPSQLSDENKADEQSDSETARPTSATLTSAAAGMQRYPRPKSQTPGLRARAEEVASKVHTTVRRSVSAAVNAKRQRKPSVQPLAGSAVIEPDVGEHDYYSTNMPWIDAVIEFLNCTNFSCDHQSYCLPNCFERQQHQCRALLNAVKQVYGSQIEPSFVLSVDRQMNSKPSDAMGRSVDETTVGSHEHTEDSSESGGSSSHFGSAGDLSSSDITVKLKTKLKKISSKPEFPTVPSHESLTGLCKPSDSEADLNSWLTHRAGMATVTDGQKTKLGLFSRAARRKESQYVALGGRRDSTSLLEKLRLRSSHRQGQTALPEQEALGLTSLLGLGMLAGAGAGLLRPSASNVGLFGTNVDTPEDDGPEPDRKRSRRSCRQMNTLESPIQRYVHNQIKNLCSSSLNLLCKAALLLTNQQLAKVVPLAWELLLEPEEELTSSAGEFRALWIHRHHVWSRLDEGAPNQLRLPPPFIEFVLPSPTLGYPGYETPDPAWQIRKGTSAEEVQLKQNEATKTFVTASTSRRKQQQELLARALAAETLRRRDARRQFHLTTCPVMERAALEPALNKEHRDEGLTEDGINQQMNAGANMTGGTTAVGSGGGGVNAIQEEFSAAMRRLSVAPVNRNMLNQGRNSSWRQGSIPWFRNSALAHDDDDRGCGGWHSLVPTQPLQQAQYIFPSALCAATVLLIHLLDDTAVNDQGVAVNTIAEYCVFQCLLEDTTLFMRFILERLTRTHHKGELIFVLRKMIQRLPGLPMQSAHIIFNNLVGYIMFHVRASSYLAPEAIACALSVLHLVVPHVQNIYFKDLKQTLRREQIDSTLLLTANLPCAKQFNVFDNDIGVAQLVRLQDDNKISNHIFFLHEELTKLPSFPRKALETEFGLYGLAELGRPLFGLDTVHKLSWCQLLSNLFTQMPSTYPWSTDLQLFLNVYNGTLILHAEDSSVLRQCLAFFIQCCYQFKMTFSTSGYAGILPTLLRVYNQQMHNAVLTQAVEFTCRQFYVMHRTPFILQLFGSLANYVAVGEEHSPVNDDFYWISNHIFFLHEELTKLPSFPRKALETEFGLYGLAELGRPLFGLDTVHKLSWCQLLSNLFTQMPSTYPWSTDLQLFLNVYNGTLILHAEDSSVLRQCLAFFIQDFCYEEEEANWSVLEALNLCVAVIVYAPDSYRARQMLVILQALLPYILRDLPAICAEENCGTDLKKCELNAIQKVSIAIRQLISTTEFMTRRAEELRPVNSHAPGGPTERRAEPFTTGIAHNWTRQTGRSGRNRDIESGLDATGWTASSYRGAGGNTLGQSPDGDRIRSQDNQPMCAGRPFSDPREVILQLASDFLVACQARLTEIGERQKIAELLRPQVTCGMSGFVSSVHINSYNGFELTEGLSKNISDSINEILSMNSQGLCRANSLILLFAPELRRAEELRPVNSHAPGGPTERRAEPFTTGIAHNWTRQTGRSGRNRDIESGLDATGWTASSYRGAGGNTLGQSPDGDRIRSQDNQPMCAGRPFSDPREVILQLASDFLVACQARLTEIGERQKIAELLRPQVTCASL